MTMRNVGIVFSPTLGIPAGVFSLMLGEFNRVFNVDADNEEPETPDGGREEGEGSSDLPSEGDRRNSRKYSNAAADQLLGLSGRSLTSKQTFFIGDGPFIPLSATTTEEGQSDGDDFSTHDESGTETTEGDGTVESSLESNASPADVQQDHQLRVNPPDTPTTSKLSKASHVAATRGLNVSVTASERGNRHSRMMGPPRGLPMSPRPPPSPRSVDTHSPRD